jgi:hypothetical protein
MNSARFIQQHRILRLSKAHFPWKVLLVQENILFQCADFSVVLMLYRLAIIFFETSNSSQLIFLLSEDNKNTNKIVIMIIV